MAEKNSAALIRTLSDLLQLDHDAVRSYQVAIDALSREPLKKALRQFKRDHQRHIREISALIESNGGKPLQMPHASTGLLKLAIQSLGAAGGDRAVLLTFRSNEWESMQKYGGAARRRLPADVKEVVRRGADDEKRHYRWAVETLAELGADDKSVVGRVEQLLERLHGGAAMGLEAIERVGIGLVSRGRSSGAKKKAGSKAGAKKKA
ncbi:MAG: ferritin-like domain-containing protein [Gemmatimonadetes bacterium]|nr:ferritin-like domain-containing protein [Gemmatimonadota bacterium]